MAAAGRLRLAGWLAGWLCGWDDGRGERGQGAGQPSTAGPAAALPDPAAALDLARLRPRSTAPWANLFTNMNMVRLAGRAGRGGTRRESHERRCLGTASTTARTQPI